MLERIPKDKGDTSQDAFDFRHPPFTHAHTRGNLETSIQPNVQGFEMGEETRVNSILASTQEPLCCEVKGNTDGAWTFQQDCSTNCSQPVQRKESYWPVIS